MYEWLQLTRDTNGWNIHDSGRFKELVDDLKYPSDQYPTLACFIGNHVKSQALRAIFPRNNTQRRCVPCLAKLHISTDTIETKYPVLFIEGNSDVKALSKTSGRFQSLSKSLQIRSEDGHNSSEILRNLLYIRLFFSFSHVICLFAEDIGSPEKTKDLLVSWLSARSNQDEQTQSRPELIIVLSDPQSQFGASDFIDNEILDALVPSVLSTLTVVDLRSRHSLSPAPKFEPLRDSISRAIYSSRAQHEAAHLLFSAAHLRYIIRAATVYFAQRPQAPFDVIKYAREGHEAPNASHHLQEFMRLSRKTGKTMSATAAYIASGLILNAYPPGMHEFDPQLIFKKLYAETCSSAWRSVSTEDFQSGLEAIELQFCLNFTRLNGFLGTATQRRRFLAKNAFNWAPLRSSICCLSCLIRGTDEMLPCGHAICNTCARIWGKRASGAEYHVELSFCVICQEKFQYITRCLPPTKRPDVLVLDGGGIRGVISLAYLKELERRRGGRPLRNDFHLSVGTSVGGLIISEIFLMGSSAAHALERFKSLASEIFSSKQNQESRVSKAWSFICHLLADAAYDSYTLDYTLQKAFSHNRYLFDVPSAQPEARIALTTSHVEQDGMLCLLTNYRHFRNLRERASYTQIMPRDINDEPLLWQAARCCVAALGYFRTHYLDGIGTLQDAGVRANCPLRAAIRETSILWPTAEGPDIVVSVGTGFDSLSEEKKDKLPIGMLKNNFISRGIRTFLFSPAVDGNKGFEETVDNLPEPMKSDVFRLDTELRDGIPELDDIHSMEKLSRLQCHIPDELCRALLATSFFFELDEEPVLSSGRYYCKGSILCCKFDIRGILSLVHKELPSAQFVIQMGASIGQLQQHDGCKSCGYYRKQVSFDISSLDEQFALEISSPTGCQKIGGFPTSITRLMECQRICSGFGRPDHSTNNWPPLRSCYCTTGSKRSIQEKHADDTARKRRKPI